MARDLVCRLEVEGEGNRFFSEYGSGTYYFCSHQCKRKFDDHPDDFIREEARRTLGV